VCRTARAIVSGNHVAWGRAPLNNDQASSSVLFIVGVAIAIGAEGYELGSLSAPNSGLVPFLTGLGVCLFSVVGFAHATISRQRHESRAPLFHGTSWRQAALVVVVLVVYLLLLKHLGFLLCTALFIGFLLRAIAPRRWSVVIGMAILTALACYGIFEWWLKAQLPKGFLGI